MEPDNVIFWVEKGSVHIRFNQFDEAVKALNKAISLDPNSGAAYRMLGYCQAKQNKNNEACANFQKAKELGDEVVDQLIEKYCK
jgi:Flp pilus assembly protein TadD